MKVCLFEQCLSGTFCAYCKSVVRYSCQPNITFAMCFCLEHPVPTLGQQQHYTHACAKTTVFHQNACCSGTEFGCGIYCYTFSTRAIPSEQLLYRSNMQFYDT